MTSHSKSTSSQSIDAASSTGKFPESTEINAVIHNETVKPLPNELWGIIVYYTPTLDCANLSKTNRNNRIMVLSDIFQRSDEKSIDVQDWLLISWLTSPYLIQIRSLFRNYIEKIAREETSQHEVKVVAWTLLAIYYGKHNNIAEYRYALCRIKWLTRSSKSTYNMQLTHIARHLENDKLLATHESKIEPSEIFNVEPLLVALFITHSQNPSYLKLAISSLSDRDSKKRTAAIQTLKKLAALGHADKLKMTIKPLTIKLMNGHEEAAKILSFYIKRQPQLLDNLIATLLDIYAEYRFFYILVNDLPNKIHNLFIEKYIDAIITKRMWCLLDSLLQLAVMLRIKDKPLSKQDCIRQELFTSAIINSAFELPIEELSDFIESLVSLTDGRYYHEAALAALVSLIEDFPIEKHDKLNRIYIKKEISKEISRNSGSETSNRTTDNIERYYEGKYKNPIWYLRDIRKLINAHEDLSEVDKTYGNFLIKLTERLAPHDERFKYFTSYIFGNHAGMCEAERFPIPKPLGNYILKQLAESLPIDRLSLLPVGTWYPRSLISQTRIISPNHDDFSFLSEDFTASGYHFGYDPSYYGYLEYLSVLSQRLPADKHQTLIPPLTMLLNIKPGMKVFTLATTTLGNIARRLPKEKLPIFYYELLKQLHKADKTSQAVVLEHIGQIQLPYNALLEIDNDIRKQVIIETIIKKLLNRYDAPYSASDRFAAHKAKFFKCISEKFDNTEISISQRLNDIRQTLEEELEKKDSVLKRHRRPKLHPMHSFFNVGYKPASQKTAKNLLRLLTKSNHTSDKLFKLIKDDKIPRGNRWA